MKLENLTPAATQVGGRVRRLGRGQGSGLGGTSTRGHKGAQARSGYHRKKGFEGGQMPIQRRLPKFGFTNPTRVEFRGVNVCSLEEIAQKANTNVITIDTFVETGFAKAGQLVKVLGNGELSAKLEVSANAFSAAAVAKIEAAGGTTTVVK